MIQVKLIKNKDNGNHYWNDWVIEKKKDSVGSFYHCVEDQQGLWFDARILKEVRTRVYEADAAHRRDGTVLDGVHKTQQRLKQEHQDRPAEQKLAAADQKICDIMTACIEKAEAAYAEFMEKLQEAGLEGISHPIEWKADAVVQWSYLVYRYRALLRHDDPVERKQHIEDVHQDFIRRLTGQRVDSFKSGFHGAVELARRSADHEFFRTLDSFLRCYSDEAVEAPDPISWI